VKSASAKAKGRRLQQQVARDILARFPGLAPDDITSRSSGAGGTDLLLSPAALRVFPYAVETKNQERVNLWAALAQAEANAGGLVPLVVLARNRTKPVAVLDWRAFLWLCAAARGTLPITTNQETR
jgi:hypothetical protein